MSDDSLTLSPLRLDSPLGKRKQTDRATAHDTELAWREYMECVAEQSAPRDLSHPEIQEKVERWRKGRRLVLTNNSHVNPSHCCTKVRCLDGGLIDVIDRNERLFGCLASGRAHLCMGDDSCYAQYTDVSGMRTCILSSLEIGPFRDSSVYSRKPDTGKDDQECNSDYYEEPDDDDLDQEDPVDMLDEETREFAAGMEQEGGHETRLEKKLRLLTNRAQARERPQEKKKKEFNMTLVKKLSDDARTIIGHILFTPSVRRKLNDEREAEGKRLGREALDKYYKECCTNRTIPYAHVANQRYQKALNSVFMLLETAETPMGCADRWVETIVCLWRAMSYTPYFQRNHSNFHFKQHVIATLYMMKNGLSFDAYKLLPPSRDLQLCLPHKTDLHLFTPAHYTKAQQYTKSAATQGTKNIHNCFSGLDLKQHPDVLAEFEKIRTLLGI